MQVIRPNTFRSTRINYQEIGCTPHEEECTQVGQDTDLQKIECKALIGQLQRMYGPPPPNTEFCLVKNSHEFGVYYEAGIIFPNFDDAETEAEGDTEAEEALTAKIDAIWDYINKCENLPDKWDEAALQELEKAEHPRYFTKVVYLKTA